MPVYYFDSSAVVKRYRYERGSERVIELLDDAEWVAVARLSQVEVASALVRRGRSSGVSTSEVTRALEAFDRDLRDSFDVVELDTPIIERAVALTRTHSLRAADAVQLACAVLARGDAPPADFVVVSSDQELNAAAAAEGFPVIDPTRP